MNEMNIAAREDGHKILSKAEKDRWLALEDRWLEKYNQLKVFYQKHGDTSVTYTNCADKSLVDWTRHQRSCCKIESRIKLLNAIGYDWDWCLPRVKENQWLEKYKQLKEFYEKHGHTRVTHSNCSNKSLVHWVQRQRKSCDIESRKKLLNDIGYDWSPLKVNAATAKKSNKATDDNQCYRGNDAVYDASQTSAVGDILDESKSTGNNLEARESGRCKTFGNSSISDDIGTQNELNRNLEQQKSKFNPTASDCRGPTLTNLGACETIAARKKQELNKAFDDSDLTDTKPKSNEHARKIASKKLKERMLSRELNEAEELQERLLRQSANRVRDVSRSKRKFESIGQTHALNKPADVNDLPRDHWKSSDLYYRLGLPKNASKIEIKKQFRKLVLACHPDKSSSMVRFQAIKEAYELLCKP